MARDKTITVATYPDGRRFVIRKVGRDWWWDTYSGSSHYQSACDNARRAGATVTREPNPYYRPRLTTFERLMNGGKR